MLIAAKTGAVSKVPAWLDRARGYKPHDQPGELYNLRSDLGQRTNLYAEHPERVGQLSEKLKEIRRTSQVR